MAFELGGRADKFGNRYERRYFVSLMAKVLQGGLLSVYRVSPQVTMKAARILS